MGTPQAQDYWQYISEDWAIVPKPDFWHPDRVSLQLGERLLRRLDDFVTDQQLDGPLRAQCDFLHQSLVRAVEYLQNVEHAIAFAGDIGAGKSTGISIGTGYALPGDPDDPDNLNRRVILETNTGGATICEVRLKQHPGAECGIIVQPQSMDEIFAVVGDLCESLMRKGRPLTIEASERGVPQEINRALRNMARLGRGGRKAADGRYVNIDPAAELAGQSDSLSAFRAEFFERLRLGERTTCELWFDAASGKQPLEWIKDTFTEINNGRRSDVSLPRRVDILFPTPVLKNSTYPIEVIDTKGVDGTAIRPDIEGYLDDGRILTVLCSRYNSAPDLSIQQLIEHLQQRGAGQILSNRGLLLVLVHGREALDTKDDSGFVGDSPEEGYEIKRDQVANKLAELGAGDIPIIFFNARTDDPEAFSSALVGRVQEMRAASIQRLAEIEAAIDNLIDHLEEEISRAAMEHVRRQLVIYLSEYSDLPRQQRRPYDALIRTMRTAYPRTVWATARRNGTWGNLDAYHLLGVGTAMDANTRSLRSLTALDAVVTQMLNDDHLEPAHGFLAEIQRNAEVWKGNFLSAVTNASREIFRAALYEDDVLWDECVQPCGLGPGYRDTVADSVETWFLHPDRGAFLDAVEARLTAAWEREVMRPLRRLSGANLALPAAA